jgi:hypothetical protein
MIDVFICVKYEWKKIYGREWIAVKYLGRAKTDIRDSGPRISTEKIAAMMLDPLSIG